VRTTVADPAAARPLDLVDRRFTAAAPNQLWLTDFVRHEALSNRVGVGDLHRRAVAAARS
jgi:transposase InsO family protein